jgi:hypothetical protein
MSLSSTTRKCLWAFAYASTASVSIYGTMRVMNTDPESLLNGWQQQTEKSFTPQASKSVASVTEDKTVVSTNDQKPGFQIGPFDESAGQKKECNLAPDEIQAVKDWQVRHLKDLQNQNIDPRQDYEYLSNLYNNVNQCPDNLQALGLDKKQFLISLRQAAIAEMQEDHRSLMSGKRTPNGAIKDILDEARYAAISDDGITNVAAGLESAHLPSEAQLKTVAQNKIRDALLSDANIMRSFTGGGIGPSRPDTISAIANIKIAMMDNSGLSSSIGVSPEELKQVEARVDADRERENREYRMAHPSPQ